MKLRRVMFVALKIVGGFVFLTLFALFALLYVGNSGIPFVEGDHVVINGEAYKFQIGMAKTDVFESIQKNYAKEDYYLRTLWLRQSPIATKLEGFENTKRIDYKSRKYSEHKVLIRDNEEISLPFIYTRRWDIEMPSNWVNAIYLEFEKGRLIEIRKSRWLFERP